MRPSQTGCATGVGPAGAHARGASARPRRPARCARSTPRRCCDHPPDSDGQRRLAAGHRRCSRR
ncbi:MAG: hypothetical protein MZV64_42210 [Ignavibacteriales bacterium]|nr:hypothetical protein [Ignavibacteriales bacterium]